MRLIFGCLSSGEPAMARSRQAEEQKRDDNQLRAFCTHSGGSVRSKDARGFVVGDGAEYAFACMMISLWEGASA